MAARPGDPGRWMAGAIRCLLVRVERLERQLAGASESSKGEQAARTPLGRISRCAVSVVRTLVSLESVSQEGVLEWMEPVRLEPQGIEIVLLIKEDTVEELMLVPRERVEKVDCRSNWGCTSISRRDSRCGGVGPA